MVVHRNSFRAIITFIIWVVSPVSLFFWNMIFSPLYFWHLTSMPVFLIILFGYVLNWIKLVFSFSFAAGPIRISLFFAIQRRLAYGSYSVPSLFVHCLEFPYVYLRFLLSYHRHFSYDSGTIWSRSILLKTAVYLLSLWSFFKFRMFLLRFVAVVKIFPLFELTQINQVNKKSK